MRHIQRWTVADLSRMSVVPAQEGDLVTYADHVEALRQARAEGRKQGEQDQIDLTRDWGLHQHEVGRLQGQRDALAGAVARVEALDHVPGLIPLPIYRRAVIAAIKGDAPHDDPCDCDQCRTAVQG